MPYLGRIIRNLSINRWYENRARKRGGGAALLSELSECIPSPCVVEQETDGRELTLIIERWLLSLPDDDRILFMRRYWYGDSIKRLAAAYSSSPNKTAGRLYRLRVKLKSVLEKEGVVL